MLVNFQLFFLLLAFMGSPVSTPRQDNPIDKNCSYNGKKLYGKIKFVENFPDIKIKIVENFPDLKVQIVENFPDLKVKFVDNFPGMP
jgi:hypothetical protein